MSDLISRSAFIKALNEYVQLVYDCDGIDNGGVIEYQQLHEEDKTTYIIQGFYEAFGILQEQPTAYDVEKSIDEIETKVYKDAVCVGCGYLKDNICTYKGSACGVSKPMLENIKRVFENIRKGGVNENNN